MHRWREPSFNWTKKNIAPTGKNEGRINPVASKSPMYLSIACHSGRDRLYSRGDGRGAPGKQGDTAVIGLVGWKRERSQIAKNFPKVVVL